MTHKSEMDNIMKIMKKYHAFTLIELLVVISIIALLVAILMPALNKAREQAKFVVCSSNMHQVVLGVAEYAVDNNGKLLPNTSRLRSGNWHLPHELNFHPSNNRVVINNPETERDYHYVGRYLKPYLEDVKIFNCPASPIDPKAEWPPAGAGGGDPVDTYENLYRTGQYAPLHCTYMPFWNYQGYNYNENNSAFLKHIEGPKSLESKTKLLLQDAMLFKTDASLLFPQDVPSTWFTTHRTKETKKNEGLPFYSVLGYPEPSHQSDVVTIPEVKLNAAYLDTHVESFTSREGVLSGCAAHISLITREYE